MHKNIIKKIVHVSQYTLFVLFQKPDNCIIKFTLHVMYEEYINTF